MCRPTLCLLAVLATPVTGFAADKPRDRPSAESKPENLARYKIGGFGASANATLGVKDQVPDRDPPGRHCPGLRDRLEGEGGGIQEDDVILEVDGAPVGFIRERYYELWPKYGRSGKNTTEVLVSFLTNSGERKYYYLPVRTSVVTGERYGSFPEDFFTVARPKTRDDAEDRSHNVARYVLGYGNFNKYARFELGVNLSYSPQAGATIIAIKPGSAAATAGLQVGDHILKVEGARSGSSAIASTRSGVNTSTLRTARLRFLISFDDPSTGQPRYYYPQVKLRGLTTEN